MARLDKPLGLDGYYYNEQQHPWCSTEAGIGPFRNHIVPYYESISYNFDHQIDNFKEQIKNCVQDVADEACVKSYRFCNINGVITYDISGEQTVRIHFLCKVSISEVLKFKDFIYDYIDRLTKELYSRFYKLDFNLEVIETSPIQELAIIFKEENTMKKLPEVKKIIHSGDYTHIIWEDDTKTSVKRASGTPDDPYSAFAQAVVKKLYGSTEKAKFEHELKQKSVKEQKKILAEKEARRAKQQKREERKISKELARQEKELEEKKKEVEKCREKKRRIVSRKDNK